MDPTPIARAYRRVRAVMARMDGTLPRLTRYSWGFDVLVAFAVLVYTLDRILVRAADAADFPLGITEPAVSPALMVFSIVLSTAPLTLRRRFPLSVFVVVIGARLVYHDVGGLDHTSALVPVAIAGYSALMYSPYRAATVGSVLTTAVLWAIEGFGPVPRISSALIPIMVLVPAGLAYIVLNTWKQRAESSRVALQALEAERLAVTRLAVEQERARLAGELHDVVTHNVSMMVIQAGAARMMLDADPEQSRVALLAVEGSGRAAMAELRHAMGLLTMNTHSPDPGGVEDTGSVAVYGQPAAPTLGSGAADPTTAALAPPPGLAQAVNLVARVRETGVPVALTVTGTPEALPPGADLAGYRIVQEALTNTVKHAHGASVQVTVAHSPGRVTVDVTDTGGVPGPTARLGGGHGLTGLRDRLAVYHGTLRAEKRPTGGFRVHAVIPTGVLGDADTPDLYQNTRTLSHPAHAENPADRMPGSSAPGGVGSAAGPGGHVRGQP